MVHAGTSEARIEAHDGVRALSQANASLRGSPDIRVDYFGAEHGYTVGKSGVEMLCVVRNAGPTALPAKTLRVNCYALTGLEYTTGETRPAIPPLMAGQKAAFRWRLDPTASAGPLVAGVLVESIGAGTDSNPLYIPSATVAAIPRFKTGPRNWDDGKKESVAPRAAADAMSARVGNDRVIAHIKLAEGGQPVLFLAGKEGAAWREVAAAVPLALVRSGEEGQAPWWETFRWQSSSVVNTRDLAALTLLGSIGDRWKAEFVIEARRETGILNAHLRLAPRRAMRLFGVQFPRLLCETDPKADGATLTDHGVVLPETHAFFADSERIAAQHMRALTYGIAWPAGFSLAGWQSHTLPAGDLDYRPILGAKAETDGRGDSFSPGQAVQFPVRLFALAPSDTVRDALRAVMP